MCFEQNTLAATAAPNDGQGLAAADLEIDAAQNFLLPDFLCNERTAIIGDESSETRGGSADIFGDGGASITVAQTFDSQPASLNCAALLIPAG